jgi:YVTN family beta-propeller protein
VSVISTGTDTVTATIRVGSGPLGVAVSPDGSTAYVANYGSGTVSVINADTGTVTATISVGSYPYPVAVTPDGSQVWVGNYDSGTVSVINADTDAVTSTLTGFGGPHGIAFPGPATAAPVLLVGCLGSNTASFDPGLRLFPQAVTVSATEEAQACGGLGAIPGDSSFQFSYQVPATLSCTTVLLPSEAGAPLTLTWEPSGRTSTWVLSSVEAASQAGGCGTVNAGWISW